MGVEKYVDEAAVLLLVPLLSAWAVKSSGKSKMSRIFKLDIACEHLARRRRTSSTSTRVREVGQGVTKKEASFGSSYLHRSIANPATRKCTEFNLGLKELILS